jgi:hypothetical protein
MAAITHSLVCFIVFIRPDLSHDLRQRYEEFSIFLLAYHFFILSLQTKVLKYEENCSMDARRHPRHLRHDNVWIVFD